MSVKAVVLSSIILITRTSSRRKSFKVHFLSVIANEAATPEGRPSSWQIIEPCMSTEEKSHLSVKDFFDHIWV